MKMIMKLSQVLNMPKFSSEIADGIVAGLKDTDLSADSAEVVRSHSEDSVHANGDDKTAIAYVSTRDVDREGDVVMPSGVKLKDFKRSPQVFWNRGG